MNFNNLRANQPASDAQSVCVFSDTIGQSYSIAANGSGGGNRFVLSAPGAPQMAFVVEWADSAGQSSGVELKPGIAEGQLVAVASDPACASGAPANATLIVSIPADELGRASSGVTYSGALTLIVAPQ